MPVAALFDNGGDHTAIMRSIFEPAAPEGWTVQHYNVSGLGALPIAQAIADGASLIINPNPVGLPTVWDSALAAGVPVVSAHASNDPIFVSAGYVGWPVVVSAAETTDTDPRTSNGPGVELTIRPAQTITQSWATASSAAALATLFDEYGNWFDARAALRSLAVSSYDWQGIGLVDLCNVPSGEGAEILSADLRAGLGWTTFEDSAFQVEPSEILPDGFCIFGNASSGEVPLLAVASPDPLPASGSALRLRATMHVASATPALLRLHGWQVDQVVAPGATVEVDLLGGYLAGSNHPQVQVRGTVPGAPVDVHLSGLSQEAYAFAPTDLPDTVSPPNPPLHVRADGGVLRFLPWQGSRYYRSVISTKLGATLTSHYVYPLAGFDEAAVDLAEAFGFDDFTFDVFTQYDDGTLSEPVTLSVDTGLPPVVHPVASDRNGGAAVVAADPSTGCDAQFRYRTAVGGEWTVTALGDELVVSTRRAAEVQAQQVDVESGRASGWSSPILVPGLPSAEATAYLP